MRVHLLAGLASLMVMVPAHANDEDSAKQCSQLFEAEDYEKAFPFCFLAAQRGDTEAQANLGRMYNYGFGVGWDRAEAALVSQGCRAGKCRSAVQSGPDVCLRHRRSQRPRRGRALVSQGCRAGRCSRD